MKFGIQVSYSPKTNHVKIVYDRSIIAPSPHANNLPETIINPLNVARIFAHVSSIYFLCAKFHEDRSIIGHSIGPQFHKKDTPRILMHTIK